MANETFASRHIGPTDNDQKIMLQTLSLKNLDDLTAKAMPAVIRSQSGLDIGPGLTEMNLLARAKDIAKKNKVFKSYIGCGYYNTHTPTVILRNILENPGWYTAYTPYQAEISQGRMEALLNFQTMVAELTGMEISNASLLDEGTAAAEAMALAFHAQKKNPRTAILVDADSFPQTIQVLRTRAEPLGIKVDVQPTANLLPNEKHFAVFVQYTKRSGEITDLKSLSEKSKTAGAQMIVAADVLSLCLLKSPGELGADIVVGNTQRFGVPMGNGGPHAAFLATKKDQARMLPGRLIGVSKDAQGNHALRLTLQTREQHIRREKATSNICTAQVLLAVMASMYAIFHGPEGLQRIASQVHRLTSALATALQTLGYQITNKTFFDTITVQFTSAADADKIYSQCLANEINLGRPTANTLSIALDETTNFEDIETLVSVFAKAVGKQSPIVAPGHSAAHIPASLVRTDEPLKHGIFKSCSSETDMLRYIHKLETKDLALNKSMIPLGSCTMKLNATTEMIPVTWPEFANIHPFAPQDQTQGYAVMISELENWLSQITGFAGVSLQPNAGSQGEYAGLLAIREFFKSKGQLNRNICLIPMSAHGTNPASAVMAGFEVVAVACDDNGNISVSDLQNKAEQHRQNLGALMITYPSTHGVFEESIKDICKIIHDNGGQVYMDGANMNALVGLAKPGEIGADVCHLNLHKTFCIPHGGGGPGVGPIGVAKHLVPYLPSTKNPTSGSDKGSLMVSSAPYGSASILPISWSYIAMMGDEGLKRATEVAILNANYVAQRLKNHYPILYKGKNGFVAHECILDCRHFKTTADVGVDDIAKRLMDYGFHAPTMSWPVPGTLMVEPTESESLAELDRFCDAMIEIRKEIAEIEQGKQPKESNVLKNAPHTQFVAIATDWKHTYSREKAVFPLPYVRANKFWPTIGRVDNVFGDRNIMCSCPPMGDYNS